MKQILINGKLSTKYRKSELVEMLVKQRSELGKYRRYVVINMVALVFCAVWLDRLWVSLCLTN